MSSELLTPTKTLTLLKQDGRIYTLHSESHPEGVCGHAMRGGRFCTMNHDHRGRHASVTYLCDGCGKRRRGQPHRWAPDGEYEMGLAFCFMCSAEQILNPFGDMYQP